MDELSLYYDEDKENPVEGSITFDPILAGKTTTKEIYIENNIEYKIETSFELNNKDIELIDSPEKIDSHSMETIKLKYSPKLTEKEPIEAELSIKVEYVVTK